MVVEYTLQEISNTANELWQQGKAHKIWAFHGEMGNGKTTLINALCTRLQVQSNISSPTFAIINEYKSLVAGTIYHMDWYRMKDEEEAIQAGIDHCLSSGNYCFIEWPEKAPGLLPDNTLHIHFTMKDTYTRQLVLQ